MKKFLSIVALGALLLSGVQEEALAWTGATSSLSSPTGTAAIPGAGLSQCVAATPTITNVAYASGNNIGGLQTISIFRTGGPFTGLLNQFMMTWNSAQTPAITVYIFSKTPSTTFTNAATPTWTASDMKLLVTPPFTLTNAAPSYGISYTSAAQILAVSAQNTDSTPGPNLYVALIVGTGFTPNVGDLGLLMCGIFD